MTVQLLLASGSSRRRELLDQIGLEYEVFGAAVDETALAGEAAADYVCRIALEKARWAASATRTHLPVLAADTAVVLNGQIMGKPADTDHAADMLRRLSGQTHKVYSAVSLLLPAGIEDLRLSISEVTFGPIDERWIAFYCAIKEPMDKAGAYAIQGRAAQHISRLAGSYSGVMGLPLFETADLLRCAGIPLLPEVNLN
ncbi:MAG TPA: Maf family protein [Xanthomonadales bacterium]|nr:Maf family protein [Xanthomonadales bacterium]